MLKVLQVTDLHLQADPSQKMQGVVIEQRWQTVLEHIQTHHHDADLLVLTGDLVHHSGPTAYQRLVKQLDDLKLPAVWLPGNHDDPEQMRQYGTAALNRKIIDLGGWRLVLLDSTANADGVGGGSLARAELALLQETLVNSVDEHLMVLLHHNPVHLGSGWQDPISLGNADAFWHCISTSPAVRCVLFGHVHQAWDLTEQGVRLCSSPAVAPQYKACSDSVVLEDDPQKTGPAYTVYHLADGGQVNANVVRL
ncbi:metallophosphoesterase [Pontibacterium granulatum]|uniref:metallophosphoesterase n=1 Tax=Pontibacterium granulatum TaxID=2036029 RepID=UPI00249C5211|nr:metallophosphoesterase [Pontibacterium granulatum]MDI3323025.1 metallophosphoesterase [Pontibacterium granulatum]